MKKWLVLLLTIYMLPASAQRTELGIQAGACNYWGDLAPKVAWNETHPTLGMFCRVNLNHTWAFKFELNRYTVSGSDNNFSYNAERNLSFQSKIQEFSMNLEFNFLKYGPYVLHEKFTSYVYMGLGVFRFDPMAYMGGTWYTLSDYRTENVAYKKYAAVVPMGIGLKYMVNKRLAFECQLGFRKAYTDYLDDVSTVYPDITARFQDGGLITATLTDRSIEKYGTPQFKDGYRRGDPEHKDWYTSFTLGCTFRLRPKMKCARFF